MSVADHGAMMGGYLCDRIAEHTPTHREGVPRWGHCAQGAAERGLGRREDLPLISVFHMETGTRPGVQKALGTFLSGSVFLSTRFAF